MNGLGHDFDSSWTCNHCGVAEEKTRPGDRCPKRPPATKPETPVPTPSLEARVVALEQQVADLKKWQEYSEERGRAETEMY